MIPELNKGNNVSSVQVPTTNYVAGSAGFDAWVALITNGLVGYGQNAAGDGFANLLKYATGSNPTNADGFAAMHGGWTTSGNFGFMFNRNPQAYDVTMIVERTPSIANGTVWFGIATNVGGSWGGATNIVEAGTGTPVSVTVQDSSGFATNRFMRLRVTRP